MFFLLPFAGSHAFLMYTGLSSLYPSQLDDPDSNYFSTKIKSSIMFLLISSMLFITISRCMSSRGSFRGALIRLQVKFVIIPHDRPMLLT